MKRLPVVLLLAGCVQGLPVQLVPQTPVLIEKQTFTTPVNIPISAMDDQLLVHRCPACSPVGGDVYSIQSTNSATVESIDTGFTLLDQLPTAPTSGWQTASGSVIVLQLDDLRVYALRFGSGSAVNYGKLQLVSASGDQVVLGLAFQQEPNDLVLMPQ